MAKPPFDTDAEYAAARSLAAARQQIATERADLPEWEELTDEEREQSAVIALNYLRAGRRIGIFTERRTIDEYVSEYAQRITGALDAEGIIPDEHEVLAADTDDGPGMHWTFRPPSLSLDESWPEGVTIIWDWRQGWLDNFGTPLMLPRLSAVTYVAEAIRAHLGAFGPVTKQDGPDWYDARPLEHLLTELAEEYA